MFARMLTFLTLVTFVGAPAAARSADAAKNATPTIIVRVDSINNLLEDVKYLGELAGQKDGRGSKDRQSDRFYPTIGDVWHAQRGQPA